MIMFIFIFLVFASSSIQDYEWHQINFVKNKISYFLDSLKQHLFFIWLLANPSRPYDQLKKKVMWRGFVKYLLNVLKILEKNQNYLSSWVIIILFLLSIITFLKILKLFSSFWCFHKFYMLTLLLYVKQNGGKHIVSILKTI